MFLFLYCLTMIYYRIPLLEIIVFELHQNYYYILTWFIYFFLLALDLDFLALTAFFKTFISSLKKALLILF